MDALEIARLCAKYADDKKAEEIVLLDLRGLSPVTDFFVICSAVSSPQLRAVRDEIVEQMRKEHGQKPLFVDGSYESQWLIVNFPNVLVHIQSPEKREILRAGRALGRRSCSTLAGREFSASCCQESGGEKGDG